MPNIYYHFFGQKKFSAAVHRRASGTHELRPGWLEAKLCSLGWLGQRARGCGVPGPPGATGLQGSVGGPHRVVALKLSILVCQGLKGDQETIGGGLSLLLMSPEPRLIEWL